MVKNDDKGKDFGRGRFEKVDSERHFEAEEKLCQIMSKVSTSNVAIYYTAQPETDTRLTVPRRVGGWVDVGGWLVHRRFEC